MVYILILHSSAIFAFIVVIRNEYQSSLFTRLNSSVTMFNRSISHIIRSQNFRKNYERHKKSQVSLYLYLLNIIKFTMSYWSSLRKSKYVVENNRPVIPELLGQSSKGNAKVGIRRVAVLNSLYLERITDLMSSELDKSLSNHGFAITKVNNVFHHTF